jgi:hypothetical protein
MEARRAAEDAARAVQTAEECNAFVRQAMEFLAEPSGLRQPTVERATQRRGWAKRQAALIDAHNAWVDADYRCAMAYLGASVRRAKAAHELLTFALGGWTIPAHIAVPRAAI